MRATVMLLDEAGIAKKLDQLISVAEVIQKLALLFVLVAIAILAILVWRALKRRATEGGLTQEGMGLLDYGNLLIVALGLVLAVAGFLVILILVVGRLNATQALAFLTALFGLITGLVGIFFGIKVSSDAQASAAGDGAIALTVTSVTPSRDATGVSTATNVRASFSKAVTPTSISEDTFKLMSSPAGAAVLGTFDMEPHHMTVTFLPDDLLEAGGTYEATITTDVADQAGNKLAEDYTWQFKVAQ